MTRQSPAERGWGVSGVWLIARRRACRSSCFCRESTSTRLTFAVSSKCNSKSYSLFPHRCTCSKSAAKSRPRVESLLGSALPFRQFCERPKVVCASSGPTLVYAEIRDRGSLRYEFGIFMDAMAATIENSREQLLMLRAGV
jgi:hypothetical protein